MFVSDKIVYLQMHKAASTHITRVLQEYCDGHVVMKHAKLKDPRSSSSSFVVSSVRNPWDWYVSLWAFGCKGLKVGGLHNYFDDLPGSEIRLALSHLNVRCALTSAARALSGHPNWQRLYSDHRNEANFREWLKLILGSEGMHIGFEGYASSAIKRVVGLMTYRFLALTTDYVEWMRSGRKCRSYEEVVDFAEKHTILNDVLRVETLDQDILRLLEIAGINVSPTDAAHWGKHNTSVRREYSEYYDEQTSGLVKSRERFIIERFCYRPDVRREAKESFVGVAR